MNKLKVINGGMLGKTNIFKDLEFSDCIATNTRLMGVVAIHITWNKGSSSFEQLFHLDYSEYGIDGYYDSNTSNDLENDWKHMSSGLGGNEVEITLEDSLGLIEQAININLIHRKNHSEDLVEFQHKCENIYNNMLEGSKLKPSIPKEFMKKVCKKIENNYEAINYFIMRIYDHDFHASLYLSDLSEGYLENLFYTCDMSGSLIRNRIIDKGNKSFLCNSLILSESGYYYNDIVIKLNDKRLVTSYTLGNRQKISDIEAAFYTKKREYITLFNILTPMDEFDLSKCNLIPVLDYKVKENGLLNIIYNNNNSHVLKKNYFMNDDVYGTYFITKSMQLLLMSHKILNINRMENDIMTSSLMKEIELVDRYQFETQVLESFMNDYDSDFENFIYNPETDE